MSILLRFGFFVLLTFILSNAYAQKHPQILIPAYGNPCCDAGKPMWENLLSRAQESKIPLHVIFNPASGSGSERDPNYIDDQGKGILADVHNAGAVIYAYVASNYAKKPLDDIKADIDRYFVKLYSGVIDGVFIDEMSNDLKDVAYYQDLYRYIKDKYKNAPVIGNPGTPDTENSTQQSRYSLDDYASSVDIMVTFEDSQAEYNDYQTPAWLQTGIKNQAHAYTAHILHSASRWDDALEQKIINNQADFIYITPDTLVNPYDTLTAYWTKLLALTERLALKNINLPVSQLSTIQGSHSEQAVSVLAIETQQGNIDNWDDYKEFSIEDNAYLGTFSYALPTNYRADDIVSLKLLANYQGALKTDQLWQWQIFNSRTETWQLLGDNSDAADWQWTHLEFDIAGAAKDYLNKDQQFTVRYSAVGQDTSDSSLLDLLSLQIQVQNNEVLVANRGHWWKPAPNTSWQWEIDDGDIDTSLDVAMYDIDLFQTPQSTIDKLHADGRKVICYFSAGSYENWRPDIMDFPNEVLGKDLQGWDGEKWLDIRRIDLLSPIMLARLDLAVAKGCDGVEPDNVDGYTNNTGYALTGQDQINYNRWLAKQAHQRNLSIGLKNDVDQIAVLLHDFDWALNEECVQYQECDKLSPFVNAGKAVFGVEYQGNPENFCPELNQKHFSWLRKNLGLDTWVQDCRDYPISTASI